jgi:glucokinase
MLLAADIGGTKTVVALFEPSGGALRAVRDATYPSREHPTFDAILDAFLGAARPPLVAACFGVAGAVVDGCVQTTNLPWELREADLAARLGAPVKLLNDLEATAYGMLFLAEPELVVLNRGSRPRRRGNIAVIAAGTGLGEALLVFDGARHVPVATEGGHASFSPRTEREIALLRHLRAKFGPHVSWERVLSGPGLADVYGFLRAESGAPEPRWLAERLAADDPGAVVTQAGLAGDDAVCADALELFASLYGAEAGNMALRGLALGGVFVGGGIAPRIRPVLERGGFVEAFCDKGRFRAFNEAIPVALATNPRAALIGAARYAQRL